MRSEQKIFELLLDFAKEQENVRAVYLNGSRTNPQAPKDPYQDYDIVYVVNELAPFVDDQQWIEYFGTLAMKQEPDYLTKLVGSPLDHDDYYMFLMLFNDGVRIDSKLLQKDNVAVHIVEDHLIEKLFDKDYLLDEIPTSACDQKFWVTPPTRGQFIAVCNDFWWCLQNVGKGIKRQEFSYAVDMYEGIIRPNFNQIINWRIGLAHEFRVSVGKAGKFLPRFFSAEKWQKYLETYSGATEKDLWQAVFTMIEMFKQDARVVARHFGYAYNLRDEAAMIAYLLSLKTDCEVTK